nr:MAG TPA: hypothetical protein [Caudoviricetes sp.]
MTVQQYLKKTWKYSHDNVRPPIVCPDGFKISVQASKFHYCSPRIDNALEYTKVELGFPNQVDDSIIKYAEDEDSPLKTVYGYVPIDVVEKLIKKHGGIVNVPDFEED